VIDITGQIAAGTAINGALLIKLEEIFTAPSICLFGADDGAYVLYDSLIGGDRLQCEQT
jgi:hypothetical protein